MSGCLWLPHQQPRTRSFAEGLYSFVEEGSGWRFAAKVESLPTAMQHEALETPQRLRLSRTSTGVAPCPAPSSPYPLPAEYLSAASADRTAFASPAGNTATADSRGKLPTPPGKSTAPRATMRVILRRVAAVVVLLLTLRPRPRGRSSPLANRASSRMRLRTGTAARSHSGMRTMRIQTMQ